MAKAKTQKKSTTKAKRTLVTSRVMPARTTGKKTAGAAGKKTAGATGMRAATNGRREAQLEEGMPRTRRPAVKVARASKIKRRPRKSNI